jgi:sialic acid synthase SpsE
MDIEDLKVLRENLDNLYLSKQIHEDDYLPSEEKSRLHARRSIVIKRDMKTGEKISLDDVIMKRP